MFLNQKVLLSLPLLVGHAFAQPFTNATCGTQYGWMNNSLNQSPCLIAAYLAGVCNNGSWSVFATNGPSSSYTAPSGEVATPCECNIVFYNLIEACAACQGGTIRDWSYWIQSCPQTYIAKSFPYPIPSDTKVPTWADIDPTTVGFWSPNIASAYAVGTSAAITPGSTSLAPTTTIPPTTVSILVSPTPSPQKQNGPTPVGAIAGGVAGGVVLLILIALGIWFLRLKRQRSQPQTQHDMRHSTFAGSHNGTLPGGVFPAQMSSTRPISQATSAPFQQQPPLYPIYPLSVQNPYNPAFQPSSPSSNQDVSPLLDADTIQQSHYSQQVAQQSYTQSGSVSPQSSPSLDPYRGSSAFSALGLKRELSAAPPYEKSQ